MAKYLVVHPKLNLKTEEKGVKKLRRLEVGSTVELSDEMAKKLLEQRKIKVASGPSAKVVAAKS